MICLTMLWQLQHAAGMGTMLAPLIRLLFCMHTKQHRTSSMKVDAFAADSNWREHDLSDDAVAAAT
jgi:hypothetical protein